VLSRVFAKTRRAPGQLRVQKDSETIQPERGCYADATLRSSLPENDEIVLCLIPSLLDRCCQAAVFKLWVPSGAAACGCEVEDRP
jgi:hypothetical protein